MGITHGRVLISYDLTKNDDHDAIKDRMKEKDYKEFWSPAKSSGTLLPNTTLSHHSKTTTDAIADLKSTCKSKGADLTRVIATLTSEVETH